MVVCGAMAGALPFSGLPPSGTAVAPPSGKWVFPSPLHFLGHDPHEEPDLFARAPWFTPEYASDGVFVAQYATKGWLPGGLPLSGTSRFAWEAYATLPDEFFDGNGRCRPPKLVLSSCFSP